MWLWVGSTAVEIALWYYSLSPSTIFIMSLAAEVGQVLLERAVSWLGQRTPRVFYMPVEPNPNTVALLDISSSILPEHIILLAVLGVIFLIYLGVLLVRTVVQWSLVLWQRAKKSFQRPSASSPNSEHTTLAQILSPHITASQIRAIQRQEQLRLAALQLRSVETSTTESLPGRGETAYFPSQSTSSRGRSRQTESRTSSIPDNSSARVTRSISARNTRRASREEIGP